jgi:hypothetical protein
MTRLPGGAPRCKRHPRALAGWQCSKCDSNLCPDCAALKTIASTSMIICASCGELAAPVTIHRSSVPFHRRVLRCLRYPLSPSGLLSMAALSAVMALMLFLRKWAFFGGRGFCTAVAWGSFWAYMFKAIRTSAMGDDEVHTPDFSDFFHDLVVPAIRGTAGTALIWLPSLLYLLYVKDLSFFELFDFKSFDDPVLWSVFAVSLIYVPMALMVGATGGGVFRMLNPVLVVAYILRMGVDYWIALLAIVALTVASLVLNLISAVLAQLPIPLLAPWLARFVVTYPPFAMANVLGLLLYVRGDRVDYGLPHEYQMEILPGAQPRGQLPVAAQPVEAVAPERSYAPIALEEDEPASPVPKSAAQVEATPAEGISAAAGKGDWAKAIDLFAKAGDLQPGSLDPNCYFGLAQEAAKRGDYRQAVRALQALMRSAPDDAIAPRGCLLLARIYSERLSDRSTAERLFRHLLQRYPKSSAAQFAQSYLARTTEPSTA